MMWRKPLLMMAAMSLLLGRPAVTEAASCEDICADLAAANCERINSVPCSFYIAGCLAGCSFGKMIQLMID